MKIEYLYHKIIKKLRGNAIKNSSIHNSSKIESGSQIVNSFFDKHSFCGYNCDIINAEIGSFCSIAYNVKIGGGMHPIDWVSTSPVFYSGRDSVKKKFSTHERNPVRTTKIGHDVWIGESVIIKQGITVGDGAVIGMGSIVTKDVPAYSIVGGNPAKLIRMRFSEEIINELKIIKWWNLDEEKLHALADFFTSPEEFIKHFKSNKES